ncbi:BPTI/Kunitz domain-containing protein-like [Epargyreus clarus]|uniref:BPTI/Kunitz domain-containing protein-like n=1 Tax=Epargyreus clarus TaxID=520877 RepID=UPI003C2EBDC6
MHYNTYSVKAYRSTPYSPRVIDKTCLLNPDHGPCRAEIPMYFYNPRERNCTVFTWGGCQGNGNRFDTRRECLTKCWSKPNEPKTRPKWCQLTFDYGYCFGDLKRWYYDHVWKVCKQTIYSGCGGNKNNFYNEEQCESICRFGNGRVSRVTKHHTHTKKVLIVNPEGATSKRGKIQPTQITTNS